MSYVVDETEKKFRNKLLVFVYIKWTKQTLELWILPILNIKIL